MKRTRAGGRRRVVLIGLALVALGQFGLAVAVERFLPELRDPEYGFRLRSALRLVRENPGRPLVLAIGSSRTQMGLSPADLGIGPVDWPGRPAAEPLVLNFGTPASGPLHEWLLLRGSSATASSPTRSCWRCCRRRWPRATISAPCCGPKR